jgi:hypothetical protein
MVNIYKIALESQFRAQIQYPNLILLHNISKLRIKAV